MHDPTILSIDTHSRTGDSTDPAWHDCLHRLDESRDALKNQLERLSLQLQQTQDRLAVAARKAALADMTVEVVHRLQNALAPILPYMQLIHRRVSDDAGTSSLVAKVGRALQSLDTTLGSVAQLANDRQPSPTRLNLSAMVDEVCAAFESSLESQGIQTVVNVPVRMQVVADRDMFRRALTNLVTNAIDAMPDGGSLVITAYEGPRGIELEVADSGAGLLGDSRRRAFDPFFTTKSDGAGLGLTIVRRVAQAHGGEVTADHCPEGGAAFTIRIPRNTLRAAA
jgi:signal transduction histidine kinase